MADDWEDIAFGAPVAASGGEWEDVAIGPSITAQSRGALSALGEVGQGLTFGFLPEIEGGVSALGNSIASVLGGGNGATFGENYRAKRDASEAELKAFEKENPWSSVGLQVTGGVIPAAAGGIASAGLGAAEAAPGLLSSLARNVFGVGIKQAPTIGQLARLGAIQGGLTGAGYAEEGSRLQGAATGGAIGTLLGPVIGKTTEFGLSKAGDFIANRMPVPVEGARRLSAEAGAIGLGGADVSRSLTPQEVFLAKQLKNTPIEKVASGQAELEQAVSEGVPLFLPEAVKSPKVDRNAQFIANFEPSMEYSKTAIDARTAAAQARASTLLENLSPESSAYEGATKMAAGADEIIQNAQNQRKALSDPLYAAAYEAEPIVTSPKLDELLGKDQALQKAVKLVRQTANNADLPENSAQLLVKARQELSNNIETAISNGESRKAADLTDTYNRLNGILHKNDKLRAADILYGNESAKIEELTGSFLKKLQDVTADKVQNVGQLFSLSEERISQLRSVFEKSGKLDEWNAGVRAHLQNVIEGTRDGANFTQKIIGNTLQEGKLQAALGDSYDAVSKGLRLENRMFIGKNKYFAGSPTFGLGAENEEMKKGAGILQRLMQKDPIGAIKALFGGGMSDEMAQGLAKIYFDPKAGSESLKNILPLLERYQTNRTIATGVGRAAGGVSSRESVSQLEGALRDQRQQPSQLLPQSPAQTLAPQTSPAQTSAIGNTSVDPISFSGANQGPIEKLAKAVLSISEASAMETTTRSPNMDTVKDFNTKVVDIAKDLDADPAHLLAVMNFETGGTLDSKVKNKAGSGATGLIQFMPATAKELTKADSKAAAIKILEDMTPTEQLDYVKKYLEPFKGKLNTLDDVYMAVLYPKAVGKDADYALFEKGTKAYWQNRGLDINEDGIVTKAEAASKVRKYGQVEA